MKRSEMVEKLKDYLPNESGLSNTQDASDLLKFLEDEGMLPPPYFTSEDVKTMTTDPDIWMEQCLFGYEGVRKWEDDV